MNGTFVYQVQHFPTTICSQVFSRLSDQSHIHSSVELEMENTEGKQGKRGLKAHAIMLLSLMGFSLAICKDAVSVICPNAICPAGKYVHVFNL